IDERSEELQKLRKKTTVTVQVLTHLKEKLQFVQKETEVTNHLVTNPILKYDLELSKEKLEMTKDKIDVLKSNFTKIASPLEKAQVSPMISKRGSTVSSMA
ncbi:hypothetical protein CBR_g68932, partial [Chara braunii]